MSVNFSKNQDEITRAWKEVVESTQESKWALFGYEGSTNIICLVSSGSKGLDELVQEFNCSLIQYAFCRVIDTQTDLNKLVLINWQGESAPLSRKGLCASHVGDVTNYFKGCTQTITIRNDDEATKEYLMEQIMKTSASRINLSRQFQSNSHNRPSHSNNRTENHAPKTNVAAVLAADRKSFWKRQEEEEKERIADEKRRAAEKQAQFERERKQREESEAKKLAQTIEQRDRLIDFTRQADQASNHSQPNSIVATEEDDGRVGRRSELIRLERNQETQSLISKGLIKNKRAIFEQQAQQAQQQRETQPTLTRRSSGAMISQRLNAFKSLDVSSTSTVDDSVDASTPVGKITNGFADKVSISGNEETSALPKIRREIEEVQLVNDEDQNLSNGSKTNDSYDSGISKKDGSSHDIQNGKSTTPEVINNSPKATKNLQSDMRASPIQDVNDNNEKQTADVSSTTPQLENIDDGAHCEAIALFDYEAADNTEISFDPDDKIGDILKVDPGWWQGKVMSGRFKGQVGLFPSNYVKEL